MKKNTYIFTYLIFLTLLLINIPFLLYYSDNFTSTLAKFTCDEVEFLFNIDLILEQLSFGKILGAAYNLYTFGYGSVYWGLSALVAAPSWLFGSEQNVVISLRMLSAMCSFGSFFLMSKMIGSYTKNILLQYVPIMLCFFSPVVISYTNSINPEAMMCFFLVLAFYLLHLSNNKETSSDPSRHCYAVPQGERSFCNRYYYASLFAFALAISTKLIAAPFGIVYLAHFFYHRYQITIWTPIKSLSIGFLFFAGLNCFLVFPLILQRFIGWVTHESMVVMSGEASKEILSLATRITLFSAEYINSGLLMTLLGLFFYGAYVRRNNINFLFVASGLIVVTYSLFCLLYSNQPYHYGLPLMYFLPIIMFTVLTMTKGDYSKKLLVVAIFIILNRNPIITATQLLLHPAGTKQSQELYDELKHVEKFLENYPNKVTSLGISHPLRPPHNYRRTMKITQLNETDDYKDQSFDLVIMKKKALHKLAFLSLKKIYEDEKIFVYEKVD